MCDVGQRGLIPVNIAKRNLLTFCKLFANFLAERFKLKKRGKMLFARFELNHEGDISVEVTKDKISRIKCIKQDSLN